MFFEKLKNFFCWHSYNYLRSNNWSSVFQCSKCQKCIRKENPKVKHCDHYWKTLARHIDIHEGTKNDQICEKCGKSRTYVNENYR